MSRRRKVRRPEAPRSDLDPYVEGVCRQVERARRRCGLTHQQLSERSGVSERMVSYVVNGQGNPSVRTLLQLALALDLWFTLTPSPYKHRGILVGVPARRRKRT